ncbi:sulfate/molybdate ABC transporter ATP-binding protein [Rhizosaccharibacter radicis]|uniref:ATP-binding cassette domain-containing protein n=1 Tax=Rhizosaccharibacter radicis TaxID=2782605 RepID=A0ABT1W146_9PROT|nr:ATP-binding cassette domain-containing protein [Acetobacteraceae bacterium KSS12]
MGVDLRNISCLFGRTPAVRDISLRVSNGEFLALVGPSGAGKTTLLRIIAGLEPNYTGQLSIGARDVTRVPARERNIGFVFQNYALFRHMTVAENVAFGLRVRPRKRRPARAAIAARVSELLELVQVGPLAQRYPTQLSGGQRQRVALARALATEPELLLLDEPFGALDPLVRKEIRTWLRRLHERLGLTSILVTHDQSEALEVADRIAVLRDGSLEQVDTPDALEDRPSSLFVHQFLGETVGFDASAGTDGAILSLNGPWNGTPARFPEPATAPGPGPGRRHLSLRPWEIGLEPTDAQGAARVTGMGRAGPFLRYAVRAPDGSHAVEVLRPSSLPPLPEDGGCALDLRLARVFAQPGADDTGA